MPLIHSKSKKALQKNIKTEMEAHPEKDKRAQNLAVAYSVQKAAHKKKKMAEGGEVNPIEEKGTEKAMENQRHSKKLDFDKDDEGMTLEAIKKENYADGGMVDLDEESEEMPNDYYKLNREAADEEQYDDSQISAQPMDSNEHGHEIEDEIDRGIVAAIRRKMASKRD